MSATALPFRGATRVPRLTASPEPEPEPRHRVARRAAKEARRAGDFDGCVTWLEQSLPLPLRNARPWTRTCGVFARPSPLLNPPQRQVLATARV